MYISTSVMWTKFTCLLSWIQTMKQKVNGPRQIAYATLWTTYPCMLYHVRVVSMNQRLLLRSRYRFLVKPLKCGHIAQSMLTQIPKATQLKTGARQRQLLLLTAPSCNWMWPLVHGVPRSKGQFVKFVDILNTSNGSHIWDGAL